MKKQKKISYRDAGVDRARADRLVQKIETQVKRTFLVPQAKRLKSQIGGYASVYQVTPERWIAATTDGVGTKLKLAQELGIHHTIGIDLVAMSANDLICVGAQPSFFLDYFATGKLKTQVASQVIAGVVEGCAQAQLLLVGGETAEMPDLYAAGEYDLAGFAVGELKPADLLPARPKQIVPGLALIGVGSSGCHSNGYSLLRKLLPQGTGRKRLARKLLTPTQIYVRALSPLLRSRSVLGLAHITGSGFLNVPRISEKVGYEIELPPVEDRPSIYPWVYERSGLGLSELAQTFNLGVGLVLAVEPARVARTLGSLERSGLRAWRIGQTVRGRGEVRVFDPMFGRDVVLR